MFPLRAPAGSIFPARMPRWWAFKSFGHPVP